MCCAREVVLSNLENSSPQSTLLLLFSLLFEPWGYHVSYEFCISSCIRQVPLGLRSWLPLEVSNNLIGSASRGILVERIFCRSDTRPGWSLQGFDEYSTILYRNYKRYVASYRIRSFKVDEVR